MAATISFRAVEGKSNQTSIVVRNHVIGTLSKTAKGYTVVLADKSKFGPMTSDEVQARLHLLAQAVREQDTASRGRRADGFVDRPCDRCGGTGTYAWGGSVNGVPANQGPCFRCTNGVQTAADQKRNFGYDNYGPAAQAAVAEASGSAAEIFGK